MATPLDAKDCSTWHTLTVRIPLPTPRQAEIVKQVIEVDRELKAHLVSRTLSLEGNELVATFACLTIRQARVSLDHFLSDVGLVIETIETFSPASDARTV